jgi:hypothetical protein
MLRVVLRFLGTNAHGVQRMNWRRVGSCLGVCSGGAVGMYDADVAGAGGFGVWER